MTGRSTWARRSICCGADALGRTLRLLGLATLLVGLVPVVLPLSASTLASVLEGCSVNEAGSTGCILFGRSINGPMAASYRLLWAIPPGLLLALIGFFLLLAGWGIRRTETRRAKHR
ncbi:hypothetical protein DFK10_07735 [Salibaculum griseiflavum]|uniref:Uncharacterized protein n=1 Tax=Salibaculum griseiflavum TaxID=1914409 RepID=A0A2V1P647_9RHOB|nr:hypothetical protein DFK10_07735 [Salibaculum griseiflavum]